jgi:hypothetical protein
MFMRNFPYLIVIVDVYKSGVDRGNESIGRSTDVVPEESKSSRHTYLISCRLIGLLWQPHVDYRPRALTIALKREIDTKVSTVTSL